ncbi:4256_t:CDS:2, partial [Ambispora leptoticha]
KRAEAIHKGLKILEEEGTKASHTEVSHTIKEIEKKIKGSDAESIANAPDITSDEAEILKLNLE